MKKDNKYFYNEVQIEIPSESTCVILCGTQEQDGGSNPTAFACKHFFSHKILNFRDFVEVLTSCSCMLTGMNVPIIETCATEAFFHSIEKCAGKFVVLNIPVEQLNEELEEVVNNHFKKVILIALNTAQLLGKFDVDAIYHIDDTHIEYSTICITD